MKNRAVKMNGIWCVAVLAALAWLPLHVQAAEDAKLNLVFSCKADNDLYVVLQQNGMTFPRYNSADETVRQAAPGDGILLLADDYPEKRAAVSEEVFKAAQAKGARVYVEYPSMLPGMELGESREHKHGQYGSNIDREVIVSEAFRDALKNMRIVMVQNCHYLPTQAEKVHIVTAHVAGYNYAVFGLPDENVNPILFEHPAGNIMVATTKLSHFVTGRYAPVDAWEPIWHMILAWLQPGKDLPSLEWTPAVRTTYGRADKLPVDVEEQALRRGLSWFVRSKLFLEPSGEKGFHEGYNSKRMFLDGSQEISTQVRGDCTGEVAMSLMFGAKLFGEKSYEAIAKNLLDLIYFKSPASRGPRLKPESPTYGLIGGDLRADSGIYYGDDFARRQLGTQTAAVLMGSDRWGERSLMDMLGHFRTTGPWGFRTARLEEPQIQGSGWENYWLSSEGRWGGQRYRPHYQAYMWATYLWLYGKTGFEPLLERTRTGIGLMMERFPDGWGSEANRHETERCRMLLPLAWLLRVDDRPEHRVWLEQIKQYVLDAQHASGAIRQRVIHETTSNEQYGTGECALIQANGDPATDLLYATNFAFIGLHEAAAVTGDAELKKAEDLLADFMVRIQAKSQTHPELDGAWYRGFDFQKWDYWGSDGDVGWGVWCIETGWTQGWITSTLALRQMQTSLWELTTESNIDQHFDTLRKQMLPDETLRKSVPQKIEHAAVGKKVTYEQPYHQGYSGGGDKALTDGTLALPFPGSASWQGFEGLDCVATVDLAEVLAIHTLKLQALQQVPGGIFLPKQVQFMVSQDGKDFAEVAALSHTVDQHEAGPLVQAFEKTGLDVPARYVKVQAKNIGAIPSWHAATGREAWLFVDEIIVNETHSKQGERKGLY